MKTLKRIAVLLVIVGFVAATVPLVWAGENQGKININAATVDELTKLKNAKMKEKYRYIAAKRKILNNDQRVLFDMKVIKKAMKGKKKGHHGH